MNLMVVSTAMLSKTLGIIKVVVPIEPEGHALERLEQFAEIIVALVVDDFDERLDLVERLGQSEQFARLLHAL
jgi:hypothetical protein